MTQLVLIRLGELWLKSEKVRRRFLFALNENMKELFEAGKINAEIKSERGRIFVKTKNKKALEVLKNVFGISSFSVVIKTSLKNLEKEFLKLSKKSLKKEDTFAIRVKRVGEHKFSSKDMEIKLGNLVENNKVDLSNPSRTIYVEIRNQDVYLFTEKIKGAGGLPLGVEGKVISLLSGGIDSPVATYLVMKRGCKVIPLFIDHGFMEKSAIKRAERVANALKKYDPSFELIKRKSNLPKVLKKLSDKRDTCVFCKREMFKVANEVAKEFKAQAIVTGESLGQVASQTLDNLKVIDNASKLPVLRPLVGFDKDEIIKIAKEISTYNISITHAVCCRGIWPRYPNTHANLDEILKIDEKLNQ